MTSLAFSVVVSDYVGPMSLLVVAGPSNVGPGERERMLAAAAEHFARQGIDRPRIVRIDVPSRGGGESGDGSVRVELEPMIPLLQSGSLFGEPQGLELVDAQNLQKGEVETLVDLLERADLMSSEVVIVAAGTLPKALTSFAKERGETVAVKKLWERQAGEWLESEVTDRGLQMNAGAKDALLQRFGSDTASMGQALDQLSEVTGRIDAQMVLDRFKNRPEAPTWHVTDAISKGDVAGALRRLSDFLVHGHPLVYLAALESDLRRHALAAAAPDQETFKEWVGGGSEAQLRRVWSRRGRVRDSSLRRAQEALVRADRVLKTQPDDMHRVTLERLTVALCFWYS